MAAPQRTEKSQTETASWELKKLKLLFIALTLSNWPCTFQEKAKAKALLNQEPKTILIWHTFTANQSDILRKALSPFESKTNTKIILETGFTIPNALLKKRKTGSYPDIVIAPSDVINLDPFIPFRELNDRWYHQDTTLLREGRNWKKGIPFFLGNHLMLFYNKSLVSKPALTWEEIRAQASAFNSKGITPVVWDYREPFFLVPFLLPFIEDLRGNTKRKMTPYRATESEKIQAMTRALDAYRTLARESVVPTHCNFLCVEKEFLDGKAAYAILGDWALKNLTDGLGNGLGITDLPSWEGVQIRSLRMPVTLSFPVTEKNDNFQKMLQELALYLQESHVQAHFQDEGYRLVANQQVREKKLGIPQNILHVVWSLYGRSLPVPSFIDALFWSSMSRALNLHLDGTIESSEAARLLFELSKEQKHLEIYQ